MLTVIKQFSEISNKIPIYHILSVPLFPLLKIITNMLCSMVYINKKLCIIKCRWLNTGLNRLHRAIITVSHVNIGIQLNSSQMSSKEQKLVVREAGMFTCNFNNLYIIKLIPNCNIHSMINSLFLCVHIPHPFFKVRENQWQNFALTATNNVISFN